MAWKVDVMHHFVPIFLILVSVGCVAATIYTVGDSSGWDISTDLDSWVQGKTFLVGDSLLFQFSQYHSLVELKRQDFDTCNTSNPLPLHSNTTSGNSTVSLTSPGDRFFSCGNSLHCLGGMKLQVHVTSNTTTTVVSPTGIQANGPTASLQGPSSLSNNNPLSTSSASPSGLLFKGRYTCHGCLMFLFSLIVCLIFVGPY